MKSTIFCASVAASLLVGCGGGSGGGIVKYDDSKIVGQLDLLEKRVAVLEQQVEAHQSLISELVVARYSGPQESVLFDPQDEQKYLPVKAPAGPVLVVLEKVEPYLDGFTVSMRLGNPTSAGYAGIKGKVSWGKKYEIGKDVQYNKMTEKELDLNDTLPAGAWTVVKFKIGPAKAEDVRRIAFAPEFNIVRLRSPN